MQSQKLVIVVALLLALLAMTACGGDTPVAPAAEAAPTEAAAEEAAATEEVVEAATEEAATEEAATEETATEEAAAAESAPAEAAAAPAAEMRLFAIDQAQSEARFQIDEELMGAPVTVVGATTLVDGSINIDLADMTRTTIGPIAIDASDFKTDRDMRDRAIRRFVLQSGDENYKFITFTPVSIEGLPAQAAVGDEITLTVNGDLTIREITRPVTFDVTVKVDSDTQLTGLAKTTVLRSDFDLQIPSVPSVANVSEEVGLELAFVAMAQ
jgi:polyisoprenoid-binding protein YceI